MRRPYCTSNWFYGLIAVYYQSRLMNVKRTRISLPFSPLGYRYPLGNCYRRWIVLGLAAGRRQLHGSSDAVSSHLVNPRGVGCFCHPLLTLGH